MNYQLNHIEYQIYKKITEAIAQSKFPKLTQVAEENFVSTTYIVKIAKKLGFSGFSEMIYVLNYQQQLTEKKPLSLDGMVNLEEVHYVAQLIADHSKELIFIFGIGYSSLIADYLTKKLSKLGLRVNNTSPIDMQISYDNSLVIFISKSGETDDVVEIAKKIKYQKTMQIVLTSKQGSTLGKYADYLQPISDFNQPGGVDLFDSHCLAFMEYVLVELYDLLQL